MFPIGGFQVTSSPPCWLTKTKDLSLAPFVRSLATAALLSVPLEIGCKPPTSAPALEVLTLK